MNTVRNIHSLNNNFKAKDKQFHAQMSKVFKAFSERPKTMLMVSIETSILRANICRYVAEWREQNRIDVVKTGLCEVSKHRAGYLTTDPSLFPTSNQLSLFDNPKNDK